MYVLEKINLSNNWQPFHTCLMQGFQKMCKKLKFHEGFFEGRPKHVQKSAAGWAGSYHAGILISWISSAKYLVVGIKNIAKRWRDFF